MFSNKIDRYLGILLFATIPLILSAFIHLWNTVDFPAVHIDEGYYLGRAMHVLEGLGPQEDGRYDHPYFGQLFLASIFKVINYPDSLHPTANGDIHSIENLYMVPRVLMGLLAVVDTFLIYKISEIRYNRNVALIASILFAVMPATLMTRRVWLENIQLPFLLSSILFAVYYHIKDPANKNIKSENGRNILPVIFSGIFLGTAIFTKIPAFTMVPLVGYLILKNNNCGYKELRIRNSASLLQFLYNNNNLRVIGLWFIPVILIPAIWPAYALSVGQFDNWVDGVLWQSTERVQKPLFNAINSLFQIDPILLVLGIAGAAISAIKRDFFPFSWIIPLLIFLYLLGFVSDWHLIPIIPALCISAALLITTLSSKFRNIKAVGRILPFSIISVIGIFGFITTTELLVVDQNHGYFKVQAFVANHMPDNNNNNNNNNKISLIGNPRYLWIPLYIFHKDQSYDHANRADINKTKALFLVDDGFIRDAAKIGERAKNFRLIYDNSRIIAMMKRPHFEVRITNIPIISAKGTIASLQNDQTGKPIWRLTGKWSINMNNTMQPKQSQSNQTYFNKTNSIIFHASIRMVNIANGTENHIQKISNFKMIGDSPINNAISSTFNGTTTVVADKDLVNDVPTSIKITKGRAISIWLDPKKVNNHFLNGPIYGHVAKLR